MSLTDFFKAHNSSPLEKKVAETFCNPPSLSSQRLNYVKISPEHAQDMFEYSCDSEVTKYLTWSCHSSLKETERYIKLLEKKYNCNAFHDWGIIHKESGKFIGTIGFTSFDYQQNTAEIGYVLARPYWGYGYAVEAARTIMKFGIEHFALSGFCAKCMEGNDASFKVMKKCGMELDGIYKNSMFIKGEYKTIIICKASAQQILEKISETEADDERTV